MEPLGTRPRAVGLALPGGGLIEIDWLAEEYGYEVVYTIFADVCPLTTLLIIADQLGACGATAIIAQESEQVEPIRHLVTDVATLITPARLYPRVSGRNIRNSVWEPW